MTRAGKRALDIVLGTVLALLALPVIVLAAVGSALCLRAWPIFTQDRIGRYEQRFVLPKIRTLPITTPTDARKYDLDPTTVPRFAQKLRDLHLDELPQIFLVITGRMTLVGPRPEMPSLHAEIPVGAAAERTRLRPGCTGLWQISPASKGLIHEAPQYDRFYVEHHTVRLDLWILAKTLGVVLWPERGLRLGAVPSWATRRLLPSSGELATADPALQTFVD